MAELSESEFERAADATMQQLLEVLIDCSDEVDCDLESGVLTITFDDDERYVVNSHRAARQIWMAAERRAWHFDLDAESGKWLTAKDELWTALQGVLRRKLGESVVLAEPKA